jgi:hypothetical protein
MGGRSPHPTASPQGRRRAGTRRLPILLVAGLVVATIAAIALGMRTAPGPRTVRTAPAPESVRQVDGGARYYARFPASLPSDPSYFPIGVWFESVLSEADIDADQGAGLNLYVALTSNSDLSLIARSGMKVIAQHEDWLDDTGAPGAEAIAGWLLADETDMQMSPPEGYAAMRSARERVPSRDGRLRYTNYGKGVTFWNTDAQAARYVNEFQDVVSADNYWFTDEQICGPSEGGVLLGGAGKALQPRRCHRAANYGRTVDRVRSLVRPAGSRPVWSFVEVGQPFSGTSRQGIEPAEVSAAVWSSIVHGARGIVYFNHSFGGPAPTQHALREPAYSAVRSEVTRTNARIRRLAPVLNAPFVDTFAGTEADVDVMTKHHGGRFYVFAASRAHVPQQAEFHVPCAGEMHVSVLDENRTIELAAGSFEDHFADGNAVHIYRIDGASHCWLPAR